MLNTEAELDSMIHSLVVSINDLLSPVAKFSDTAYYDANTSTPALPLTTYDENGKEVEIRANTKVLDIGNVIYGSDGELPPHELFSRNGAERYTRTTDAAGNVYYVYNEEDPTDTSTCYTLKSLSVNKDVVEDSSVIPHILTNGDIAYTMAEDIYNLWEDKDYTLNPNDTTPCSYSEFYTKFVGELATQGSIYKTTSESLKGTVETIESNRQAVIGVSSDEELTNLIKFQNAYNASSRYINTVSQMIDYLLSSLQ